MRRPRRRFIDGVQLFDRARPRSLRSAVPVRRVQTAAADHDRYVRAACLTVPPAVREFCIRFCRVAASGY